jgi:phage shock protein C
MADTGRVTRSRDDRVITGVCGGLARRFDIDPLWLRLGFVLLVLAGGSGVLLYIILSLVMPSEDLADVEAREASRPNAPASGERTRDVVERTRGRDRDTRIVAALLITLGVFFLLRSLEWFRAIDLSLVAPVFLIGLGVWLILRQDGQAGRTGPA